MNANEYYNSTKKTLERDTKKFEDDGYQPVMTKINDPANSILSSNKTDKCKVRITYCQHRDTCEAYKKGLCINAGNIIFTTYCPFSKTYELEGVTKRSQNYSSFIKAATEVLKINFDKFYRRIDKLRETIQIGDGSLVYLALSHLDNYVNPCLEDLGGQKESIIPYNIFVKEETIRFLLEYEPLALSGGVITTYQDIDIPRFIRNLKTNFNDLYKKIIDGTDYEKFVFREKLRGKKAVLSTLKPGKVKINLDIWNWDGKELTRDKMLGADIAKVTVIPKPETIVIIEEEETVDENTVIRY